MNNITSNQNYEIKNSGMTKTEDIPPSEIRSLFSQQNNTITVIENSMSNLFTRLGSLLSPATPTPTSDSEKQVRCNSALGEELSTNNEKLRMIDSGINNILNRLQL